MSSFVEFSITDGTTVIDLLGGNRHGTGFGVQRYTPGRPQLKNGGVWQDSPLAVGRQLVVGIDGNTADAITLTCSGTSQEQIIGYFEDLDLLLQKAQAYWTTTWQQTPVYLRARAKGETARRYALIHYGKYHEYFDPYGQLFAGGGLKVVTEEFVLGIERGPWLDDAPGEYTAVSISHEKSGAAQTGYEYSASEGVVVGNIHNPGLTHVYQFTASGSVFSSNLLDGSPPYTLLGVTMAVGNILYLGADLPFYGVKFQLSTLAGTATIAWEIWTGAAWSAVTVHTPSFTFQSATPEHIQITTISSWAKTTVNSRNKYWLRARVTAVTVSTSPVQGTRHVYATTMNYVETAATAVEGTQDALLRAAIGMDLLGSSTPIVVYIGQRSYERGADFQAQINVGAGNPAGLTVTASGATGVTANSNVAYAPGAASITVTNSGGTGDFVIVATIGFEPPGLSSFFGRFRLFARVDTTSASTSQIQYQLRPQGAFVDTPYATGEIKRINTGNANTALVDLGYISLPSADFMLYTDDFTGFDLYIRMAVPSSETVELLNLFLMPADEWNAEIIGDVTTANEQTFVVDAISYPKYARRAILTEGEPNGDIISPLTMITNGTPSLHANARQRYWFIFASTFGGSPNPLEANIEAVAGIKFNKSQRNSSLRSGS